MCDDGGQTEEVEDQDGGDVEQGPGGVLYCAVLYYAVLYCTVTWWWTSPSAG